MAQLVILHAKADAEAAAGYAQALAEFGPIPMETPASPNLIFGRHVPFLILWSRAAEAAGGAAAMEPFLRQASKVVVMRLDDADASAFSQALTVGPGSDADMAESLKSAVKVASKASVAEAPPAPKNGGGMTIGLVAAGLVIAFVVAGAIIYNSIAPEIPAVAAEVRGAPAPTPTPAPTAHVADEPKPKSPEKGAAKAKGPVATKSTGRSRASASSGQKQELRGSLTPDKPTVAAEPEAEKASEAAPKPDPEAAQGRDAPQP